MDTELARTFLAVIATGSFVDASQRLHITQSTVSSRIQRLEEQLGTELFVRNKAGTTLTPAGRQFQRHAALLTRPVEQARQEIGHDAANGANHQYEAYEYPGVHGEHDIRTGTRANEGTR